MQLKRQVRPREDILMKIIDTLIFDMDGVIADTECLKFEAYRQVYNELFGTNILDGDWRIGLQEEATVRGFLEQSIGDIKKNIVQKFDAKDSNRIKELFGNDREQILNSLEKDKIPDCMIPIVGKAKREKYAALLDSDIKPILGAVEFIKYAKEHYRLGIATGSTKEETEKILAKLKIKEYFGAIATREDVGAGRGKPLPDLYLSCLRKLGADSQKCIVIEDAVAGIQSAKAANICVIAITTTTPKQQLIDAGAVYVASTFDEIKAYLSAEKVYKFSTI